MPETSPELTADAFRRQVLLEGVKASEFKSLSKFLRELQDSVIARLNEEGETIETRRRLKIVLSDLTTIQRDIYEEMTGQLFLDLDQIAVTSSELEVEALNETVDNFEALKPAPEQIIQAYRNHPLSLEGTWRGLSMDPFISKYTQDQIDIINGLIRDGQSQGRTISQMVGDIRGTRTTRFKDGAMWDVTRHTRTMVRTAVQNAATQAKERTWKANTDLIKAVQMLATLDNRTTPFCRNIDGEEFPVGVGPRPPFHHGCRTVTNPVLSEEFDFLDKGGKRPIKMAEGPGTISKGTTYYQALKQQPKSFIDDVLGVQRGRLFRDGGMTEKQFKALQLDRNFQERTLEEMREVASRSRNEAVRNAFERAGLD